MLDEADDGDHDDHADHDEDAHDEADDGDAHGDHDEADDDDHAAPAQDGPVLSQLRSIEASLASWEEDISIAKQVHQVLSLYKT